MEVVLVTKFVRGLMVMLCVLVSMGCSSGGRVHESAPSAYQLENSPYGGGNYYDVEAAYVQADGVALESEGTTISRSTGTTADVAPARAKVQESPKQPVDTSRKLIRNARLTLELNDEDDFPSTVETIGALADAMGGYMQNESTDSATILVPTDRLDEALEEVSKLGKVSSKYVSVVDATSRYVDTQIRIQNLKKMRHRLTELVNQSTSVKEVLEVEKELARVTTELERIEGQMRLLTQQTSFATINVSLEERVKPGPLGWIFYGLGKGVKWLFIRN